MPESGVTKHNYLFCQFVNPARGHEGDRCDCFDTPSQRRTTLAKQRLARLRANREINRASTSNDPESAVASDPAVTVIVGKNRIRIHPKKLKGVQDWPTPRNPTGVRQFLGFTGYYRYFVPNYSKIARPLLELTRKDTVCVTAGSEATADSGSLEVEARLISRLARSRASLCLARVVLR